MATSFLTLAIALFSLIHGEKERKNQSPQENRSEQLTFFSGGFLGILMGLAIECRYQTAFIVLGWMAWLIVFHRRTPASLFRFVPAFALGMGLVVLAAFFIDSWLYGEYVFTPWNYFKMNILEGMASSFGTSPFYGYLYLYFESFISFPVYFHLLLGIVLVFVFWVKHPRHLLTWTMLCFFIGHSLVGHKEGRFLFPLALLVIPCVFMAWLSPSLLVKKLKHIILKWKNGLLGKALLALNLAVLVFLTFFSFSLGPVIKVTHNIYRRQAISSPLLPLYSFEEKRWRGISEFRFYGFPNQVTRVFKDTQSLIEALSSASSPVIVATDNIKGARAVENLKLPFTLWYRSMPPWISRWNFFGWVDQASILSLYIVHPQGEEEERKT